MSELFATVFSIVGMVAIFILLSLILIKVGWLLFVVPVFNLPDLTWMQALGFSLLASSLKQGSISKKD